MAANNSRRTKRRGNGEGSIYQRPDGRWIANISLGYDASGKRKRKVVYGKTKTEVREKLTRLQSQHLDGTLGDAGKTTVAGYLSRWLETTARTTVRESTFDSYEMIVRLHVSPHIGGVKLKDFRPAHVSALYSTLERNGQKPRTRQLVHVVVGRAMKDAVRAGTIPRNPVDAVDPPKHQKAEMQPLDASQARELLEAAEGDRLEALYVLALTTGCRQGELLGLQWRDVDLQAGFISIRHTLYHAKGGRPVLNPPKSRKGNRKIDLPEIAVDALLDHRKRMMAEGHGGAEFVFVTKAGTPYRKSNFIRQSFKPLLRRINATRALEAADAELFPAIRFHDLRHTAATLMLLEGVHPKVVQERLGHANIGMTLDVYSHVLPSMQADAASKIGGVLKRA